MMPNCHWVPAVCLLLANHSIILFNAHTTLWDVDINISILQKRKLRFFLSREFAQGHIVIGKTDSFIQNWAPKQCHYIDLFSSIVATRNTLLVESNYLQNMWPWAYIFRKENSNKQKNKPLEWNMVSYTVYSYIILFPLILVCYFFICQHSLEDKLRGMQQFKMRLWEKYINPKNITYVHISSFFWPYRWITSLLVNLIWSPWCKLILFHFPPSPTFMLFLLNSSFICLLWSMHLDLKIWVSTNASVINSCLWHVRQGTLCEAWFISVHEQSRSRVRTRVWGLDHRGERGFGVFPQDAPRTGSSEHVRFYSWPHTLLKGGQKGCS